MSTMIERVQDSIIREQDMIIDALTTRVTNLQCQLAKIENKAYDLKSFISITIEREQNNDFI